MKTIHNKSSIIIIAMMLLLHSCQTKAQGKVIATQGEYILTMDHVINYIAQLEAMGDTLSLEEKENEKEKIVDFFNADPKGTLEELDAVVVLESSHKTESTHKVESPKKTEPVNLAYGHKEIRRVLGTDIGQMDFNSTQANQFRNYMANSLLTSRSNSYSSGGYSDSNTKIQFCANGSYVEANYGHVSVSVEGSDASGSDTDYIPGYWDVASLPNGMFILLLYSTHPLMLEDSPNGFLPLPVAKYTANFVSLPNGDGYQRIANQPCN